jgi:hypothetical protein
MHTSFQCDLAAPLRQLILSTLLASCLVRLRAANIQPSLLALQVALDRAQLQSLRDSTLPSRCSNQPRAAALRPTPTAKTTASSAELQAATTTAHVVATLKAASAPPSKAAVTTWAKLVADTRLVEVGGP